LLAHDTYDDDAHGSRWLATTASIVSTLVGIALVARALLAETRGERGALRTVLIASVPASPFAFVAMVAAATLPLLLAMGALDAYVAHAPVDDFTDLVGGSLPLGFGTAVAAAAIVALGVHRLIAFLTRNHTSIVRVARAFVSSFEMAEGTDGATFFAIDRHEDRPRVLAALARCMGANRAPPERTHQALPA
jgi:hypothetical protein